MPRPMGHIRILLSSRVIFDLEEADRIFTEKGEAEYADYMLGKGTYAADYDAQTMGRKLKPGPLWNFVQAALQLNKAAPDTVEIGVFCKDNTKTALPIFCNLDVLDIPNNYRIATAGKPLDPADLRAFGTDLFLSRNFTDAQTAIDQDVAAAMINFPEGFKHVRPDGAALRLWVDGDAVAFGSSAEVRFKEVGLEAYYKAEFNDRAKPIEAGPYTRLLAKISQLNSSDKFKGHSPFELFLLTARGGLPSARALITLENLGIHFNGGVRFLGGASKGEVLKEHIPDLYLDDQFTHFEEAQYFCPTGLVPYKTGSPMHKFLQENAAAETPQKPKDGPKPG